MEIMNQEEFDKLSIDEKKAYLRQLVMQLPEDKAKELYDEMKSSGLFGI